VKRVVYWTNLPGEPAPARELLQPVTNREVVSSYNKPHGGLWTSPEDSTYPWEKWCRDEELGWLVDRYVLTITGEPNLLLIDSYSDLQKVASWAGRSRYWGPGGQYTDRDLDYELLAETYDGLWLTAEGHFDSRLRLDRSPVDLNTYSWDCETVLWFRWCFE